MNRVLHSNRFAVHRIATLAIAGQLVLPVILPRRRSRRAPRKPVPLAGR